MTEPTMFNRLVVRLAQEITCACAVEGGSCIGTPDGLLAVNATIDPGAIVRALLGEMREPTAKMEAIAVPLPKHLMLDRAVEWVDRYKAATRADRLSARQTWQDLIDAVLVE